jgi:myo-inositol-1(or 4)-monophosphatase
VAAGSLMVSEAGGLIGNFTGDADYLHQREVVAGNPKVYGQLVQILAPYTRVIPGAALADGETDAALTPEAALAAEVSPAPGKTALRMHRPAGTDPADTPA